MSDLNRWSGTGRLGHDCDIRYMPDGTPSVKFNLACSRYAGRDEAGKTKYATTWIPCQWISKRVEALVDKLGKGRWLVVEGQIVSYQTDQMRADNQPARLVIEVEDVTFPPESKQT